MQNMDQKSYNSKEREPEIAAKQQLLEQLENHVKYLREVNKTLVKIERDMQEYGRVLLRRMAQWLQ